MSNIRIFVDDLEELDDFYIDPTFLQDCLRFLLDDGCVGDSEVHISSLKSLIDKLIGGN